MAKENEKEDEKKEEVIAPDQEVKSEDKDEIKDIPYTRFKETNSKLREAEKKLADLQKTLDENKAQKEKDEQEKLEKNAEWELLATNHKVKLEELTPKVDSLVKENEAQLKVITEFADAQMDAVPETFKSLVLKLSPLERLQWLTENKEQLGTTKIGGIPSPPNGGSNSKITEEERRKIAPRTF